MPLNILKHKSYHVYNEKNIERVRRDEEDARIKEEIARNEREKNERSARLEALRKRKEYTSLGTNRPATGNSRPQDDTREFDSRVKEKTNTSPSDRIQEAGISDLNELTEEKKEGYQETNNIYKGDIVKLLAGPTNSKSEADSSSDSPFRKRFKRQSSDFERTRDRNLKASLDPLDLMEQAVNRTREAEEKALSAEKRKNEPSNRSHRHYTSKGSSHSDRRRHERDSRNGAYKVEEGGELSRDIKRKSQKRRHDNRDKYDSRHEERNHRRL